MIKGKGLQSSACAYLVFPAKNPKFYVNVSIDNFAALFNTPFPRIHVIKTQTIKISYNFHFLGKK